MICSCYKANKIVIAIYNYKPNIFFIIKPIKNEYYYGYLSVSVYLVWRARRVMLNIRLMKIARFPGCKWNAIS